MARSIMILGAILLVVGAVLYYAPWLLNWLGRLPGDIRIASGKTRLFIPITSMVVVSIVLTILINLFRR